MKKLIFLVLLLMGCNSPKLLTGVNTTTYYNKMFSAELVDSIIKAEHINNLDSIPIKGTEKTFYEYFYIKDSLVIRFIEKGDSIKVTKRINK